jgi:hypothetical protein
MKVETLHIILQFSSSIAYIWGRSAFAVSYWRGMIVVNSWILALNWNQEDSIPAPDIEKGNVEDD